MAAIATLVLADGQATPVNHNFAPVNVIAGLAKWTDRSGGVTLGMPYTSLLVRPPQGKSRSTKVSAKLVVPTLEVTAPSTSTGIQPAPTKAYDCFGSVEFVLPERASLQERKDILAYMRALIDHAVMTAAVTTDEPVFG